MFGYISKPLAFEQYHKLDSQVIILIIQQSYSKGLSMAHNSTEHLQTQIDELETKLAFQDQTIEDLNQEMIKLSDLVAKQQYHMELIVKKLKAVEPNNMASASEETPPPHY